MIYMETYLSPNIYSLLRENGLALLGKKKNEAEEKLVSAKKLILKVKRMGLDTKEAEKLYLEAKSALKNRKYAQALNGIENAKKSAKKTYSIGIKAMLEIKINQLDRQVKDMENKKMKTVKIKKFLNEAKSSQKGNVRKNKKGLKSVKEGLRLGKSKLSKYKTVSSHIAQISSILKDIENYNPKIVIIAQFKDGLKEASDYVNQGKINSALDLTKDLYTKITKENEDFKSAQKSIDAFNKVISDANALGTEFQSQSMLEEAQTMLLNGEFSSALKLADKTKSEIAPRLQDYKEAKHFVDTAEIKVQEVKNWGFSTYEVQKILESAKEALKNHDFEIAKAKSEECKENANSIRKIHKQSIELIQQAKDEVEKIKAKGENTQDVENIISDAESEFNKGDYKATKDKLDKAFEAISGFN
jgi:hypothetical protein